MAMQNLPSLLKMAGATRLELAAFCVTGRRSNQTELRPQRIQISIIKIQMEKMAFSVKIKVLLNSPLYT